LVDNFVPALKEIQSEVEDIRNGRVYVEKTMYSLKQWTNLLQTKLTRQETYVRFMGNIINQSIGKISSEEPKVQQIKSASKKIIDATKKIVNDYKSLFGIVPPQDFSIVHQKFLEIYTPIFETVFQLADDIEKITITPKPQMYHISVVFNIDEKAKEFEDEMKIAKARLKEQAKIEQTLTLEAIITLALIFFFVIFAFYMLMTVLR
jgi:hypothetical protein